MIEKKKRIRRKVGRNSHYVDIPENELRELYYILSWPIIRIAEWYEVTHPTIINRMKEYGFENRGYYYSKYLHKKVKP
jgi:hypothetical protein